MRKLKSGLLLAALGAMALTAMPASAAITLTSVPGSNPYAGPTPTYNFNFATPEFTGGSILTGFPGIAAQPYGSTGGYAAVGPGAGTPGILNLSSFADINFISFIWGSIDDYNTLEVLDSVGNILASWTGSAVAAPANGDQSDPQKNRLVTITFTGADRTAVDRLRFKSTLNAFEFDNVAVNAVPEPTTWMLMLMGMAGIGFSMRRKRDTKLRVRFA